MTTSSRRRHPSEETKNVQTIDKTLVAPNKIPVKKIALLFVYVVGLRQLVVDLS